MVMRCFRVHAVKPVAYVAHNGLGSCYEERYEEQRVRGYDLYAQSTVGAIHIP